MAGEHEKYLKLWVASVMARTTAKDSSEQVSPIGLDFLNSREFVHIAHMLGLDPNWARRQLAPYAGGQNPLPRKKNYKVRQEQ